MRTRYVPAETCEGGLGAARPFTTDIASQYITADKPEVTVFTSQEVTTSFPTKNTQTARSSSPYYYVKFGSFASKGVSK